MQATITIAGNGEWGMSTGNGKLKNGNNSRELEIKLLIGLGFKLGFVPFFIFLVPVLIPHFTSIHFYEFISPGNLSGVVAKWKLFFQTYYWNGNKRNKETPHILLFEVNLRQKICHVTYHSKICFKISHITVCMSVVMSWEEMPVRPLLFKHV